MNFTESVFFVPIQRRLCQFLCMASSATRLKFCSHLKVKTFFCAYSLKFLNVASFRNSSVITQKMTIQVWVGPPNLPHATSSK